MTTGHDGLPDGVPPAATGEVPTQSMTSFEVPPDPHPMTDAPDQHRPAPAMPAPLPPRIQPMYQTATAPPAAPPAWPAAPTWPASPGGAPTGPAGAAWPAAQAPSAAPPFAPSGAVPSSGVPASLAAPIASPVPAAPASGVPLGVTPVSSAVPPFGPMPPAGFAGGFALPRRSRIGVVALILALVLLVVAVAQTVVLVRLDHRLTTADRRLAAQQQEDAKGLDGLDKRASALEKRVGGAFDPAAVAADVQPSVFRVEAGDFTGTAFALAAASGGGTSLITNYHVVDQVYSSGKRDVTLVRKNLRFPATIVKVDKTNDLAVLSSKENFPKLKVASETVKPGEPIVVIGAPLGLEGSVTTGVVSALRTDIPGENGRTVIQFDAAINPGNSGGPVVNGQRQVVGVASAKARDAEGIGLAIPIAVACTSFSGLC